MDKNFSLYLTKIGLFDEKTSKEIINSKNQSEEKTFVDSAFHYLMNFFDNLDENQKKYMSYFLPNNYKIIITKLRKEKIKSLIIQKMLRQKLLLLNYLNIWKKNINLYENLMIGNNEDNFKLTKNISQNTATFDDFKSKEKTNLNKKNEIANIKNILNTLNIQSYKSKNERLFKSKLNNKKIPYNYNINNNRYKMSDFQYTFQTKKPDYNYICNNLYKSSSSKKEIKDKNKLLTSLETKELEDLKECTFKPRINFPSSKKLNKSSSNKSKENIMTIFDKLYKDDEKKKLTKELRTIDREYTLGKNFSFTPNINNRFRKIYKYQEHKNFAERQREYKEKLEKKKGELIEEINSKYELICSFNPKITNEKGEYYHSKKKTGKIPSSVFKRLYLDVKHRRNIREQKELENNNKFEEMANYLTQDKKINESTVIERLLDYNKEDIINKTKEKVEKEEGITFKPELFENEYLRNINGTFLERNEQWLFDRNNFIEQENEKQIENIRNSDINNKKYTREEREQIISNIIERLYKVKQNDNDNENEDNEENEEENEGENEEEQDEE